MRTVLRLSFVISLTFFSAINATPLLQSALGGLPLLDGLTLQVNNNNKHHKKSTCTRSEYKCANSQCISEDGFCDGREDCRDGSDERNCANFRCPTYLFKCAYGACINPDFECDGKTDCRDNSDETTPNCRSTSTKTKCRSGQFECSTGECIDDFDRCDGIENCADGSDETVQNCGTIKCPKFTFRCDYGACISPELKCNGVQNCRDGSDEKQCRGTSPTTLVPTSAPTTITTQTPPTDKPTTKPNIDTGIVDGGCALPSFPENGRWTVFGAAGNLQPGDSVKPGTVLTYQCNTQHAIFPNNSIVLCNSGWTSQPKCLKTCPPIIPSKIMTATCTLDESRISCETPYQGARAVLSCGPLYEDPLLDRTRVRFCDDGSWDTPLPNCQPVCGLKSVEAQALVIGGKNAAKGEYPWQVGIYQNSDQKLICGASIITPFLVVSAGHCFASTNPQDYLLAAGKYYSLYSDKRDTDAQYAKIRKLIIHEDYRGGLTDYVFDIALLVLETPFTITKFVLPVCVDYNPKFDLESLNDVRGVVTGWGYTTSTGAPSEVLKVLEVDYRNKTACTVPKDFYTYLYAVDKLCAGLLNKGESACQGDSGGGLSFPNASRYYIRGVVSVAPQKSTGGCDENQLTLFTSIRNHVELIQSTIAMYRRFF